MNNEASNRWALLGLILIASTVVTKLLNQDSQFFLSCLVIMLVLTLLLKN